MCKKLIFLLALVVVVLAKKHRAPVRLSVSQFFDINQTNLQALIRNGTQIFTEMLRDPFYQDFVRGVATLGQEVLKLVNIPEIREVVKNTTEQIYNFTESAVQRVIVHLEKILNSSSPFIQANEALYDLELFLENEIYKIQDDLMRSFETVKASHLNRLTPEQSETFRSLGTLLGLYQETTAPVLAKGIRNANYFLNTITLIGILRDEKRLQTLETELRAVAKSILPVLKGVDLSNIRRILNNKIDTIFSLLNQTLENTTLYLRTLEADPQPGVTLADLIESSQQTLVSGMFNFRAQLNTDLRDLMGRIFSFLKLEGVNSLNALQLSQRIFLSLQQESQKISDIIIEGIMLQELKLIYGDDTVEGV